MDRLAVMETFIRVVETGSFSAAARHLNVGQPAVSKSIAQLEKRLGTRLLIRSTRCLTPTEAGLKFYDHARRAIEAANQAEIAARGEGADLAGRVRISAPVTFARLHIVPHLPAFMAAHLDLSIDLILDDRQIDLIEEGVDIAFRIGTLRDSSLTARRIASCRRVILGAPAYFQRAGVPTTPAELVKHNSVVYTQQDTSDRWKFRRGQSEVPVSIPSRLRVTASEGLRAAVVAGIGLAVASEWMFAPELAVGTVSTILTEWTLPMSDLWAVFPTGRMVSAKARAFAAFVEAELRAPRPMPNVAQGIPDRNEPYEVGPPAAVYTAA